MNAEDRSYTYDKVGNRKTEIQNGTTYVYCYHVSNCNAAPKGNRLINIRTGSATGPLYRQFEYDNNGRLLRKRNGAGAALYNVIYNGKGRAKAVNGNSFAYDPNDYRIKRKNTLYLLEGEHLEATYSASGVLQNKYLRGVVVDEIVNGYTYHSSNANDWTNYTFHHDHLNSVTALTGHAGSIEETNRYDAFGAVLNLSLPGTGNEQLFTGRQLDVNTGLYYYRARYYDSEIGRFISEDPIGFNGGINKYAYVGNNPLNFNDPSGNVESYPDLLRQGIGVIGSMVGVGGGLTTVGAGVALIAAPEPTMLSVVAGVGMVGGGLAVFGTSMDALDNNYNAFLNNVFETNVPRTMDFRSDVLQLSGFNTSDPVAGRGFDAVDFALGIPNGRIAGNLLDIPNVVSIIDNANTVLNAGESIFNSTTSIMDSLGIGLFGSNASGGFVLYPNKINNNMVNQVYAK